MQPPLMHIGAYWIHERQQDSFFRVLTWLISRRYKLPTGVTALSTIRGTFPIFNAFSGVQRRSISSIEEIKSACQLEYEWVPVEVNLIPNDKRNVLIVLSFVSVYGEPLRGDEHQPIEITASAAEQNLLD